MSAAAGARRIGILDDKPGATQVLHPINRRTLKIGETDRIKHHLDSTRFNHSIVVTLLIEVEPIFKTGTPAPLNGDPQVFPDRLFIRLREGFDLIDSPFRYVQKRASPLNGLAVNLMC